MISEKEKENSIVTQRMKESETREMFGKRDGERERKY